MSFEKIFEFWEIYFAIFLSFQEKTESFDQKNITKRSFAHKISKFNQNIAFLIKNNTKFAETLSFLLELLSFFLEF